MKSTNKESSLQEISPENLWAINLLKNAIEDTKNTKIT